MFGILNVNKPAGWTSRDVVNRVQRLVRPAKAGHAGTLDPLATGVLVVCIGQATRLISYVQQQPKVYQATFLLGRVSPSDDVETEVSELADAPQPSRADIDSRLPQFLGSVQQRPPAFSALKVKGQRAYQLARRGEQVHLESRAVQIHELRVTRYEYPELAMTLRCGSGTYVRSVGRDLAQSLGTGAVMSALTRTAIGDFSVGEAIDIDGLDKQLVADHLVSPLAAVAHLPQVVLSDTQLEEIRHGRLIEAREVGEPLISESDVLVAIDGSAQLVSLLREKRAGWLGAMCNFSQSS